MVTITREQARQVDRLAMERYEIPGILLMENAGIQTVEVVKNLETKNGAPVVICCGKGNNGGDGFVIARHLLILGYRVHVWIFADPNSLAGDAAVQYKIVQNLYGNTGRFSTDNEGAFQKSLSESSLIIDALLGTGATGSPKGLIRRGIELINAQKRNGGTKILAIDVPSGLDCDTGHPGEPTIAADHTCTFVAAKIGFTVPSAIPFLGRVHVLNIGIPNEKFIEEVIH